MSRANTIDYLIRLRARRGRKLQEALTLASEARHAATEATLEADSAHVEKLAIEGAEKDRLGALMEPGQASRGEEVLVQQLIIAAAAEQSTAALRIVEQCQLAQEQAAETERKAQHAKTRNLQKIDTMQDDLLMLAIEAQRLEDDLQDEEAEEIAIARMLAQ